MTNDFVYIVMHGMFYEYDDILIIVSSHESAIEQVEKQLVKCKKEDKETYVKTSKDYWTYNDTKYFAIEKHEVFD